MSHFAQLAGGFVLTAAAVGALAVLPRAKPEVMPVENLSESQRVDALQKQLLDIAAEQRALVDDVKALTVVEKAEHSELQRAGSRK